MNKPIYMSKLHLRVRTFFLGFTYIIDGILCFLTLGNPPINVTMEFIAWETKRWLRKLKINKKV